MKSFKRFRFHHTVVSEMGDGHVTIRTTGRRAEAILMVLSGTTCQEAADVLGVTRQRVHQYIRDAGLDTKMRHLFRPSKTNTLNLQQFQRAITRRRRRRARRRMRMQNAIEILRFHAAEGRHLTQGELAGALLGRWTAVGGSYLCAYLGKLRSETTKQALRRVRWAYRLAGVPCGHRAWDRRAILRAMWAAKSPRERREQGRRVREGLLAALLQRKAGKSE